VRGTASATTKRHSLTQKYSSGTTRPSSTSATTTSATATTDQQSTSTHPSSIAPMEDDTVSSAVQHQDTVAGVDPLGDSSTTSGYQPNDTDGTHQTSPPTALPRTPPTDLIGPPKSDSPRTMSRMISGDSAASQSDAQKTEPQLRQSRSRSRLRGLKFWKRRKDVPGMDTNSGESTP
jgi:hypothetical protein